MKNVKNNKFTISIKTQPIFSVLFLINYYLNKGSMKEYELRKISKLHKKILGTETV